MDRAHSYGESNAVHSNASLTPEGMFRAVGTCR